MRLVLGFVFAMMCTTVAKPTARKTKTEIITAAKQITASDINQTTETLQNNELSEESDETDKTLRTEDSIEEFREHARERDIDRDVLNMIIRELKRMRLLRKEEMIKERKNTTLDYDSDEWFYDKIRRGEVMVPKSARFVDKTIRTAPNSLVVDKRGYSGANEQNPGLELQALIAIYTVHQKNDTPLQSAEEDQSSESSSEVY